MKKKLLVLDIDETLFHAFDSKTPNPHKRNLDLCDFEILDIYPTFERPHVFKFMNFAFKHYDVAIWSSAGSMYVRDAIQKLIRANGLPEPIFIYSSDNCVHRRDLTGAWGYSDPYQVTYIKDLKKLKKFGYPLSQILVVDDSPEKLQRHYGNLIRIPAFEGDEDDVYLLKLIEYLRTLIDVPNVRNIEKRFWLNN